MDAMIKPSKIDDGTAVDSVVSSIRTALMTGQFKPGDRLPSEGELVENLGVSRGTIREAMKILQAYGIVSIKRGNGTYFTEETDDIASRAFIMRYAMLQPSEAECWEFREMYEEKVLRDAIRYATADDIQKLKENLRKMILMKTSNEATAKLDVEFHILLGNISPNKLIRSTYAVAISFLEPTFIRNHSVPNHSEKSVAVHSKTIEIIESRDYSDAAIDMLLNINEKAWIMNP